MKKNTKIKFILPFLAVFAVLPTLFFLGATNQSNATDNLLKPGKVVDSNNVISHFHMGYLDLEGNKPFIEKNQKYKVPQSENGVAENDPEFTTNYFSVYDYTNFQNQKKPKVPGVSEIFKNEIKDNYIVHYKQVLEGTEPFFKRLLGEKEVYYFFWKLVPNFVKFHSNLPVLEFDEKPQEDQSSMPQNFSPDKPFWKNFDKIVLKNNDQKVVDKKNVLEINLTVENGPFFGLPTGSFGVENSDANYEIINKFPLLKYNKTKFDFSKLYIDMYFAIPKKYFVNIEDMVLSFAGKTMNNFNNIDFAYKRFKDQQEKRTKQIQQAIQEQIKKQLQNQNTQPKKQETVEAKNQ